MNYLGQLPPRDTQGPPEVTTTMNEVVSVRGGISSFDLSEVSGSANCVLKVATGASGAGEASHVYALGGHPYLLPTFRALRWSARRIRTKHVDRSVRIEPESIIFVSGFPGDVSTFSVLILQGLTVFSASKALHEFVWSHLQHLA